MNKDAKALEDAEKCIELKKDWPKGYFRKACALSELLRHAEAILVLNVALDLTLTANQNIPSEMTTKLKELVERLELNQDKNVTRIPDNGPMSKEEYDAFVTKMKTGTPQKLNTELIDLAFLNAWTCAMGHIQAGCLNKNETQVRLPFVIFHTGYSGEGGTSLLPINSGSKSLDNIVNFLKNISNDFSPNYIIVVAHKLSVNGLPYEKNPKNSSWKHKKKDGVFIQIDTIEKSSVHFIPIGTKRKGVFTFASDQLETLDWDSFSIVPRILHKNN